MARVQTAGQTNENVQNQTLSKKLNVAQVCNHSCPVPSARSTKSLHCVPLGEPFICSTPIHSAIISAQGSEQHGIKELV